MMEKYSQALLSTASRLDAVMDACGKITKLATAIAEENSKTATVALLKKISEAVNENRAEVKVAAQKVNTALIQFYGYTALQSLCKPMEEEPEDSRTLEELLEELNSLVGLQQVKEKVRDLIVYQQVQKMRREKNLHSAKNTLHLAFTGNPGTGKTTVARIVGRIYKKVGLLSKGHFMEVSRTDLIAGYQGQTALKVKKVIEQAKGGVLFIDEAYSITENENSDSYGRECLTELTKALEDYREDLVVIVAGYTEPMRKFFESNPGLKSRFNIFIEFPDYNAEELGKILDLICRKNDYILEDDACVAVSEYLKRCVIKKDKNFANGRLVRNLYDDLVMNHAKRVIQIIQPTREDLCTLKKADFQVEITAIQQEE